MSEEQIHNVIVIGSGPAGYTSCIYAARALLKPLMITGNVSGGQLMTTTDIENFPGYVNGISGPDMMDELKQQAERFGTSFVLTDVTSVDLTEQPYKIFTDTNKVFLTRSIIIATGAKAIWLDIEGEEQFHSNGISTCSTCDGFFYRGEKLLVIGGGDTAMEEATFLTRFASKVTIVHRRNEFRASKTMLERAKNNTKIEWKLNFVVKEWLSDSEGKLCGALLEDQITGYTEEISCGGVFVAIGHRPSTSFLGGQIELDEDGYIVCHKNTYTNVPGVFAAGDCVDTNKYYRQAITASSMGCKAALDCERWLEEQDY